MGSSLEGILGSLLGGGSGTGGSGAGGSGGGGLVGEVLGGLASSGLAGGLGGNLVGQLAPALTGLLAGGGLQSIIGKLTSAGLGEHASSWVGTGENKPIDAAQVQQGLGAGTVEEIAGKLGVPAGQAAEVLAKVLPGVVDHLTPNGSVPDQATVDGALHAS